MTLAKGGGDNLANFRPELYTDKVILAPMVRENSLAFRLLCLRSGADLAYTEELIDYRVVTLNRFENSQLGTVDYVDDRNKVIFRTCPEERGKVVFQLGSNNPERALEAAKIVANDIAGLDFNFGCPKAFSISGGMGAALLDDPERIRQLLTTCVENLQIPITCKIRIKQSAQETLDLVKMIESCGVSAIAVHGRTRDQRPKHENNDELLKLISETVSIPIIANGGSNDIKTYDDIIKFKHRTRASSVMVGRAPMRNPSVFNSSNYIQPAKTVIRDYLKLAVRYDNYVANVKYTTQALMFGGGCFGDEFVRRFYATKDLKSICEMFDLGDWYDENKVVDSL